LALIIFYSIDMHLPVHTVVLSVGSVLIISSLLIPLITFLIDRVDNIYFGTYHAPLIISIFVLALFNAEFWIVGDFDMGSAPTVLLLCFIALINNIFLACYRYCTHSIGDKICFDKSDKKIFSDLKSFAFLIGIFVAITILGIFLDFGLSFAQIGLAVSSIVIVLGLADFFVTFQYLPIIKLKEVTKKIKVKERLRDIYVDFIKSISIKGHVKQFLAFCFSVIFFVMFYVTAYVYLTISVGLKHLEASGLVGISVLACALGVVIFRRVLKDNEPQQIVKANIVATSTWVVIFAISCILFAASVLQFQYWLASVIVAVLGFLASVNYVTFNFLFVDKLKQKVKAPFNLCTIVYIFCFGLVTIIVGLFVSGMIAQDNSKAVQNALIGINVTIAVLTYLLAALLFLLANLKGDKLRFKIVKSTKLKIKKKKSLENQIDESIEVSSEVVE